MFNLLNPWLLAAALSTAIALFGGGMKVGIEMEKASQLEAIQASQEEAKRLREAATTYAIHYEESRQISQDTASQLRIKTNEYRGKLADCDGRFALLNSDYVRLRNESMQTRDSGAGQPPGASTGAVTPEELLENDIENGQRWKQCRDQLNTLIAVVKSQL